MNETVVAAEESTDTLPQENLNETCLSAAPQIGKHENSRSSKQPGFDKPLTFTLTPNQILHSILFGCEYFTTSRQSSIEENNVVRQIKAENNGNYCWLMENEWNSRDSNNNIVLNIEIMLEIKIGKAYIYSEFGSYDLGTARTVSDADWQRGETAFIKAAALLGIRVKKELVVG